MEYNMKGGIFDRMMEALNNKKEHHASEEEFCDVPKGGKHRVKKKDACFYEPDDHRVNVIAMEMAKYDGSDSGVEMNGKCTHCLDLEADGPLIASCNSSVISGHSSSPCYADVDELTSNFHISTDLNDYSSRSCDGTSENGSESSSVSSSRKCRPNCINLKKPALYPKPSHRSSSVNSKRNTSQSDKGKTASSLAKSLQQTSPTQSTKYNKNCATTSISNSNNSNSNGISSSSSKCKTVRSLSSNRSRSSINSSVTTEDKYRWPPENRFSNKSMIPSPTDIDSKVSALEKYATLPRRQTKTRESICNNPNLTADRKSPTNREPSLNRAASLRKKFLDNNIMSTSLTNTPVSSPVNPKTFPAYVKHSRTTKTTIYHEVAIQTSLTNNDVTELLAGVSPKSFKYGAKMEDFGVQVDNDHVMNKVVEGRVREINEELKRVKVENSKQRNVIEWLEGELSSTKEEKLKLQNQLSSFSQRIKPLLKNSEVKPEDELSQLEKEITCRDQVISQQEGEINELQQMCSVMKKDLEKSYMNQQSLIESQRMNEAESIELQEFLQAEKSMLSDSLKDLESEVKIYKEKMVNLEQELINKSDQCSHLVRISEQQRQENLSLQVRLTSLEHKSRELLLQQGAAVSSASVALSGLASRFDLLLEQLITAYNISDNDIEDGLYHHHNGITIRSSNGESRDSETEGANNQFDSTEEVVYSAASNKGFMNALFTAICNAVPHSSFNSSLSGKELVVNEELLKSHTKSECICDSSTEYRNDNSSVSSSIIKPEEYLNLSQSVFLPNEKLNNSPNKRNSLPIILTNDSLNNSKTEFDASESLNNLSEAILMRQQLEGICDDDFLKECVTTDISLVDQVVEIDNIVTKLLKVIRIIQLAYISDNPSSSLGKLKLACKDTSSTSKIDYQLSPSDGSEEDKADSDNTTADVATSFLDQNSLSL